ncbi:MAG: biotin--[acetyl-CoA-carboxylase] ligase, partial [Actinomycetota bacterium]
RPEFQNPNGFGWLSLLAALAITDAANSALGSKVAGLKWPNDVLIREKKVSGVLAQATPDLSVVVVGFGINVFQSHSELPILGATSLSLEGCTISRDEFLAKVLKNFASEYQLLKAAGGDASLSGLREKVISASKTIGLEVTVSYPDQSQLSGLAIDIDQKGHLVIDAAGERVFISAADITHLRPQLGKN